MILYNKLYNIDKYGHKKIRKQMRPLFQSTKQSLYGNKKYDIIRVAQENLFMLKRLSEKTSFYNVEKWNQDYEASQYYKKNHCLHPPINFNKTQKYVNSKWGTTTRKKFYSKTHYASMGNLDFKKQGKISLKKKKKFEDYNYRDLNLGQNNNSFLENTKENQEKMEFKKISEIENVEKGEKEKKIDNNENKNKVEIDNGKHEENIEKIENMNEKIKQNEEGKEDENEKTKKNEEGKRDENEKIKQNLEENEDGNEEIKEPKKNFRDEKEGIEDNQNEKEINGK